MVGDGATGTYLHEQRRARSIYCLEELNLTRPELSHLGLWQAYADAGAQVIETNSFGANRHAACPLWPGGPRAGDQPRGRAEVARAAVKRP